MDELLERFFAYRKTGLWEKITPDEIFAIQHSDNSIGYCCISGNPGEDITVKLYPGIQGMESLRRMKRVKDAESSVKKMDLMATEDCVACSFTNKGNLQDEDIREVKDYCSKHGIKLNMKKAWPQFMRINPSCVPWLIQDDTDKKRLEEVLDACLDLAGKLGSEKCDISFSTSCEPGTNVPLARFMTDGSIIWEESQLPDSDPVVYSAGVQYNKSLAQKIKNSGKEVDTWICDIIYSPFHAVDDDVDYDNNGKLINAPYFPLIHMLLENGSITSTYLCKRKDRYDEFFIDSALKEMDKYGKPKEIIVINQRTYMMYLKLADYFGIRLRLLDHCQEIEEMEKKLYDQFWGKEVSNATPHKTLESLDKLTQAIEAVPDFSGLSSEMIVSLYSRVRSYQLNISDQQAEKLQREYERRLNSPAGQ